MFILKNIKLNLLIMLSLCICGTSLRKLGPLKPKIDYYVVRIVALVWYVYLMYGRI